MQRKTNRIFGDPPYFLETLIPIFYDPSLNYETKRQELIINDGDMNEKIENYKLQRIKKLKDYKKVTVAEMLMWMD